MKINEELLKKIAKKGTALVLAGTLLAGSSQILFEDEKAPILTVCAAEQSNSLESVEITGQFGVNLYMDDKRFIPTDVNGYEVYPFIVDGTTYVPLRAISNLFEADIKWDDNTKSIYITKKGSKAKLDHVLKERSISYQGSCVAYKGAKLYIDNKLYVPIDVNGNEKDIYIINGTTYVPLRAISNAFGVDINWSGEYNSVYLGKHKTTGLTVDNINDPETFKKYADEFYNGSYGLWAYYNEDLEYYIATNPKTASLFYIYMLNEEYCSDELLKEIFKDMSYEVLTTIPEVMTVFTAYVNSKHIYDKEKAFNFDLAVIDIENAEFLMKFEKMSYEAFLTNDYSQIKDISLNYLYGIDGKFCYKNGNPVTSAIVTCWPWQSDSFCVSTKERRDFNSAYTSINNLFRAKADEIYNKIHNYQLTK